jgi:hypothetical protein
MLYFSEIVGAERWNYDDSANITSRRRGGQRENFRYTGFNRLVQRTKTPTDWEVPPVVERSLYIWHEREILAEYEESEQGELELYKEYFRAAGRLVTRPGSLQMTFSSEDARLPRPA